MVENKKAAGSEQQSQGEKRRHGTIEHQLNRSEKTTVTKKRYHNNKQSFDDALRVRGTMKSLSWEPMVDRRRACPPHGLCPWEDVHL